MVSEAYGSVEALSARSKGPQRPINSSELASRDVLVCRVTHLNFVKEAMQRDGNKSKKGIPGS